MDENQARESGRVLNKMEMGFSKADFPWLSESQQVTMIMVVGTDGETTGWIGSCIEIDSPIGRVAAELDDDESKRASLSFISRARAFLSDERTSHVMHFISPISGGPAITCITNGKLRVFFAQTAALDGQMALVKVAVCRKNKEHVVLARVSNDHGANIR